MKLKLFLDDVRDFYGEDVIVVRSAEAFRSLWARVRLPYTYFSEIHLDHDLGLGDTGMDILNLLEEVASALSWSGPTEFPKIFVHTANPAARPKMQTVADKINGWFNN